MELLKRRNLKHQYFLQVYASVLKCVAFLRYLKFLQALWLRTVAFILLGKRNNPVFYYEIHFINIAQATTRISRDLRYIRIYDRNNWWVISRNETFPLLIRFELDYLLLRVCTTPRLMIPYLPSRTSRHYRNTNTTNGSNNEEGITYVK